jgi:hypothetical protein
VSLDGCSQAMNVDSLPQSSYPLYPLKDRDSTLTGLHQVVSRARLIGERLPILPLIFFLLSRKAKKNSRLVPSSLNPLSLLLVLLSYGLLSFRLPQSRWIAGLRFSFLEFRVLITF